MSQPHPFAHLPTRSSDIIGTKVVNPQDETLGDIKELVIDPATGRIRLPLHHPSLCAGRAQAAARRRPWLQPRSLALVGR
jgi:hypothetical protein